MPTSFLGPNFVGRRMPAGVGWIHTLGLVIICLVLMQAVTGMVLAMYYSPHPDAAYESTRLIDQSLPAGNLVRGMHRYGDSALLIVVVIHLLRGLVQGTYRRPKELAWLAGVFVLQILLGFGFTGSLLPWDQNAYWATLVRTEYPSQIPIAGPWMQVLLRGNHDVGALTLSRFFAIHALLLPALLLVGVQVYALLGWRLTAATAGAEREPRGPTVLLQCVRGLTLSFIAVGFVFLLALLRPAEVEFKADPADASYHPHAEWYFVWLFQIVKDWAHLPVLGRIPGWVPALGIPGLAMGYLVLLPWLDRRPSEPLTRRPIVLGPLALGLVLIGTMSVRGFSKLQQNAVPSNSVFGQVAGPAGELDPASVNRGRLLFASARPVPCSACHRAYADYKGRTAPDLTAYGRKTIPLVTLPNHPDLRSVGFYGTYAGYVRGNIRPEKTVMPKYPPDSLSDTELADLAAYLSQDPATERRERDAMLIRSRQGQD